MIAYQTSDDEVVQNEPDLDSRPRPNGQESKLLATVKNWKAGKAVASAKCGESTCHRVPTTIRYCPAGCQVCCSVIGKSRTLYAHINLFYK